MADHGEDQVTTFTATALQIDCHAVNHWADRAFFFRRQQDVLDRLSKDGII